MSREGLVTCTSTAIVEDMCVQNACPWYQEPYVYLNNYYGQEKAKFLGGRVWTSSPAKDNKPEFSYLTNKNIVKKKWTKMKWSLYKYYCGKLCTKVCNLSHVG